MSKLIRFDEDHFGFLVDRAIPIEHAKQFGAHFAEKWPGKELLVFTETDEFIDLTGKYELVPIPEGMG